LTGAEYEKAIEEESGADKKQSVRKKKLTPAKDSEYYNDPIEEECLTENTEEYKKCEWILGELNKHPSANKFYNLGTASDHGQITGNQIDLNILGQRLKANAYSTFTEFINDAKNIWANIMSVAEPGTELYNASIEIANYFEGLVSHLASIQTKNSPKNISRRRSREYIEKPLTSQEKAALKNNIMLLPQDKLQGIIEIVRPVVGSLKGLQTLEFDIDKLPVEITRALDKYVKSHFPEQKKNLKKKCGVSI